MQTFVYIINYFINFLTAKSYKNSRYPYKTVIRFFVREFIKHPSVKTHLPFQPFQSLRGVAELALLKQSSHYISQTSGFPLCFIMVRSCFKVTFQRLKDGGELVLLLNSRRFSNLRKGYVPISLPSERRETKNFSNLI